MKTNLRQFADGQSGQEVRQKQEEIREKARRENIKKWKQNIISDPWLWDMRCWDKYKDRQEVEQWLANGCEPNNCGHVVYCIRKLLASGVRKSAVINFIMQNPHKRYANRLAKCFSDPEACPEFRKRKSYSTCPCSNCRGSRGGQS